MSHITDVAHTRRYKDSHTLLQLSDSYRDLLNQNFYSIVALASKAEKNWVDCNEQRYNRSFLHSNFLLSNVIFSVVNVTGLRFISLRQEQAQMRMRGFLWHSEMSRRPTHLKSFTLVSKVIRLLIFSANERLICIE